MRCDCLDRMEKAILLAQESYESDTAIARELLAIVRNAMKQPHYVDIQYGSTLSQREALRAQMSSSLAKEVK